jgi:hypothetical protein
VVLNDNSNLTSVGGDNIAEADPNNGLYIGYLGIQGVLADDLTNTTGADFALKHVEDDILAGSPQGNYVLVAKQGSGITSLADLANSPTPINIIGQSTPGLVDLMENVLIKMYHYKLNILSGYSTATQQLQGWVRGDAPLMIAAPSNIANYVTAGIATPLIFENATQKGGLLYNVQHARDVPTFDKYFKEHPVKGKALKAAVAEATLWFDDPIYSFFVPPGTPEKYQLALTDAMMYAASLPATKANQLADGVPPTGLYTPAQMVPINRASINNDETLADYVVP